MSKMKQANLLLSSLEIEDIKNHLETAMKVIEKYGSYYKTMQEASKIEFKKKAFLLFALLGEDEENKMLEDKLTQKAKKLISACEAMNTILCTDAHAKNKTMDDYIRTYEFDNICEESKVILNNVKSHYDLKKLIVCINHFKDSQVQLNEFKCAIKQSETETLAISGDVLKMIKGKKDERN